MKTANRLRHIASDLERRASEPKKFQGFKPKKRPNGTLDWSGAPYGKLNTLVQEHPKHKVIKSNDPHIPGPIDLVNFTAGDDLGKFLKNMDALNTNEWNTNGEPGASKLLYKITFSESTGKGLLSITERFNKAQK